MKKNLEVIIAVDISLGARWSYLLSISITAYSLAGFNYATPHGFDKMMQN